MKTIDHNPELRTLLAIRNFSIVLKIHRDQMLLRSGTWLTCGAVSRMSKP
jgi:hypothetical protein